MSEMRLLFAHVLARMESNGFVETSDSEELEVINALLCARHEQYNLSTVVETPRKRRKINKLEHKNDATPKTHSTSPTPIPEMADLRSIEYSASSPIDRPPAHEYDDPLNLFDITSSQPEAIDRKDLDYIDNYTSLRQIAEDAPTEPPLTSSLPSTPLEEHMPTIRDSQSPETTTGPSPTSAQAEVNVNLAGFHELSLTDEAGEDNNLGTRYSFRRREPKQINPYLFDKHMYKKQLRNIPDAIVKATSPHRDRQKNASPEADEDFVLPDDDINGTDSQLPKLRPNVNVHEEPEKSSSAWLHKIFDLEDDDVPPLSISNSVANEDTDPRSNKFKTKRFPLNEAMFRLRNRSDDINNSKSGSNNIPAITYSRKQISHHNEDIFETVPQSRETDHDQNSHSEGDFQITQPSTSGSENNSEKGGGPERLSKKDKKSLKALRRMMPAVMAYRMLHDPKRPNPQVLSDTESRDGSASDEGQDEVPLIPGRSRIIRRSISAPRLVEVIGDPENTDSDHGDLLSPSPSLLSSGAGSDMDAEECLNDPFFADSFSGVNRPLRKRGEQLIDRMLSRTRTSKEKREKDMKRPVLDIKISTPESRPRRSKPQLGQTRLNFKRAPGQNTRKRDDVDFITSDTSMANDDPEQLHFERTKTFRRRERAERAKKQTLFTLTGDKKSITSGRRRSILDVQIDFADSGLREALKPTKRDSPLQSDRYQRSKRHATQIYKDRNANCDRDWGRETLKQTSIYDFTREGHDLILEPPEYHNQFTGLNVDNDRHDDEKTLRLSVDLGIAVPALGSKFGPATYIGQQRLHDFLCSAFDSMDIVAPPQYTAFGAIDLDPHSSPLKVAESLELACNLLCEWLKEDDSLSLDPDNSRRYELLMHSVCKFSTWAFRVMEPGEKDILVQSVDYCINILLSKLVDYLESDASRVNLQYFSILWFGVELSTRLLCASKRERVRFGDQGWRKLVKLLLRSLIRYNIKHTIKDITDKDLGDRSLGLLTAELWICLIHLLPRMTVDTDDFRIQTKNGFWILLIEVVKEEGKHVDDVRSSEDLWRLAFSLSALSHFSVHGVCTNKPHLLACWEFIGIALDSIRLSYDSEKDKNIPYSSLKKRDKYLRMVVARCYLLGTEWQWAMQDAFAMFGKLVNIFRSRLFGNLIGEPSEFPAFLRFSDLTLLKEHRRSDSAFTIYLKLVTLSGRNDGNVGLSSDREKLMMKKKLVSLTVPISGVPFSKSTPPTTDELSMLINRFSSVIVAVLLNPTVESVSQLLSQAHQYIDFSMADEASRRVCIRALMYTTILFSHLSLPLDGPLQWLGSMTTVLLDEFRNLSKALHAKDVDPRKAGDLSKERDNVATTIQLLLGSVRYIIMKSTMADVESQNSSSHSHYPHVGLLSGAWIRDIFRMKEFTDLPSSRNQVIQLVEEFLITRAKVLPPPRRTYSPIEQKSSESQDLFDEFDLDEAALAGLILGEEIQTVDGNTQKDREVAEIMNRDVLPNIYRMLLQNIGDPSACSTDANELERFWEDTDTWIDCWVGCAAIVVKNGIRPWNHYLSLGPQSWDTIIYPFLRRRVAVRFMYRMLLCDPNAYEEYSHVFISVFLQSLVSYNVTMENKYVSLILSIDGLRHPLLRSIPIERPPEKRDFELDKSQFIEHRTEIIQCIIDNFDAYLYHADVTKNEGDMSKSKKYTENVVAMLAAMQDIWKTLHTKEEQQRYEKLCQATFAHIRQKKIICGIPRLQDYLMWGFNLTNVVTNL